MTENTFKNFIKDTLCIIVLYKIQLKESTSFISLSKIINETDSSIDIFVYDNSPISVFDSEKYNNDYSNLNIKYYHNPQNAGVSMAYNEGFKVAKKQNKKWLMLVDQDTTFPDHIFNSYFQSINENPDVEIFVPKLIHHNIILSPCSYYFKRGRSLAKIDCGKHQFNNISVLNSGIFVSVKAYENTGGYNDKIKLDFADFYFIDQYRKINNNFVLTDAICQHELSSNELDFEKVRYRFNYYCNGAKFYADNIPSRLNLLFLCVLRATKLSIKFYNFTFYKSIFKYFIGNSTL